MYIYYSGRYWTDTVRDLSIPFTPQGDMFLLILAGLTWDRISRHRRWDIYRQVKQLPKKLQQKALNNCIFSPCSPFSFSLYGDEGQALTPTLLYSQKNISACSHWYCPTVQGLQVSRTGANTNSEESAEVTPAVAPFRPHVRLETSLYCYRFNASKQIIMAPVKNQLGTTLSVSASSGATEPLNIPVTLICIATLLNSEGVSKHT